MKLDERRRGLMDYLFPKIALDNLGRIDLGKYQLESVRERV